MTTHDRSILDLINSGNHRTYNIILAQILDSVYAAIILADLIDLQKYHTKKNELSSHEKHGSGWFFYTVEKCLERTGLSDKEQATAIKILQFHGLVDKANFGVPCKRHFKIKEANIIRLFDYSKKDSSYAETAELDMPNQHNPYMNLIYEPKEEVLYRDSAIAVEDVHKSSKQNSVHDKRLVEETSDQNETLQQLQETCPESPPNSASPPPDPSLPEKLRILNWLPVNEQQRHLLANSLHLTNIELSLACYALSKKPIDNIGGWLCDCAQNKYWTDYDAKNLEKALSHNNLKTVLFEHCKHLGFESCLTITRSTISVRVPGNERSIGIQEMTFEKINFFRKGLHEMTKSNNLKIMLNVRYHDQNDLNSERCYFKIIKS